MNIRLTQRILLGLVVLVASLILVGSQGARGQQLVTQDALEYLAARQGVPLEQLLLTSAYQRDFEFLSQSYWFVKALDTQAGVWYRVMINLADGSFVDDIEALQRADDEARFARYGKLEPALAERLESMRPDETVMVAIWVAARPARSQAELFAELAARHP